MGFQVNTNIASLQAQDNLRLTSDFQQKTIGRVTSGLRITSSGDDAAGLAIANGFRSDISVLSQGIRNANDGLSTLQIIDGGINNISKLLDRARTLATQSASGTFTGSRSVLNSEFQSVLEEINRQAQTIGLDTGGQFAKSLQVFIGGGRTNGNVNAISNGSVGVNLSSSTVDSKSLGLKGVQVKGVSGTDIGAGSASTSVATILANSTNTDSLRSAGSTQFRIYGPGFGDADGVTISVNTASVTDADTLAQAVNAAIENAGNGATQAATAFRNANVVASVNTDANGAKQLTFTSSSTAFQVEAGDRLANALLGNFERNAVATGTDTAATVATNGGGTADDLTLSVDGGTAFTVTLTSSATLSKGQAVKELNADATFASQAVAYLEGNQVVIRSKGNSATSSVDFTSTTLATNLGLSDATAASASTGADVRTRIQGASATSAGSTTFDATGAGAIQFRFTGGNLAAAVDLSIDVTAATTVTQAISALNTAIGNSSSLADAGISLTSSTAANTLVFTSTSGEKFSLEVTGDKRNLLGLGSFVTGANSAIDYSTISGSSNYATSKVGSTTLEFSIAGQGSSTNSVTVDLTGGDATAASVTATNTAATIDTSTNTGFSVRINGTVYTGTVTSGATTTKATIATDINTIISGSGATATLTADNKIVLTTTAKGAGQTIQFLTPSATSIVSGLGFTAATTPTTGTSRSGASVADALNAAFAADPQLAAAGLKADFNTTAANKVTVTSTNGTNFRVNSSGAAAAGAVLGYTNDNFTITASTNDALDFTINGEDVTVTLTAGTRTAAQIATDINTAFTAAGIDATAAADNGYVKITNSLTGSGNSIVINTGSANATLGLTGGTYSGTDSDLGFGVTGASFTGNLVSSAPATSARFNAAGASATSSLDFGVLQYGDDDQSITITANDANGVAQSKTIVLQNDGSARSGRTLDEAIDAINTALQQSNNDTLKKVVAVKDNSSGTEKISFLSSLNAFKVAVGSVPNSGDGVGSAGTTVDAAQTAGGANSDISTQATAEAAVTALADAVSKLGDAQAVVGRGQNQLNYAINLAQSQLTNVAAAESRIRDADLAQEAANLTKAQIILQAGVAALAQANSAPQAILGLLRG
jgi:flagellin